MAVNYFCRCLASRGADRRLMPLALSGALKSRTVTMGNADLKAFGVDRAAKSRALAALEGAGLIQVAHQPGRLPTVTLPVSAGPSGRGAGRKNNQKIVT
jgi:hypothetical protein